MPLVPPVVASVERNRQNNFDFLRLFLAAVVVFSHGYYLGGAKWREPLLVITRGQAHAGTLAVWCFFAISGYLITASWFSSKNARHYLAKRVRRIYPAFVGCLVFEAIVIAPLSGGILLSPRMLNILVGSLLLNNVVIVNAFVHNPMPGEVNGSLWTIPYEFCCYLAILATGVVGVLQRRAWVAMAFVAAIAVRIGNSVFQPPSFAISWHAADLAAMYLAGVVAFLFRDRIQYTNRGCALGVALLGAGCLIPHGMSAVFPVAGVYVLFCIAFTSFGGRLNMCKHGDLSYGLYLYAFPIQQLIVSFWKRPVNPLVLFCAAAPVALVLAGGSWFFVERHFLKRRSLNAAVNRTGRSELKSRWTAVLPDSAASV